MNSIDFCYWLQGYFEISGTTKVSEKQAKIIQTHINLVFKHEIDPMYDGDQKELQDIHDGGLPWAPHTPPNDPLIRC